MSVAVIVAYGKVPDLNSGEKNPRKADFEL